MGTDDKNGKKKQAIITIDIAITPVIPSDNTYSFTTTVPEETSLNRYVIVLQLKTEKVTTAANSKPVIRMIVFSFLVIVVINLVANFLPSRVVQIVDFFCGDHPLCNVLFVFEQFKVVITAFIV